jgi:hypothetical protein
MPFQGHSTDVLCDSLLKLLSFFFSPPLFTAAAACHGSQFLSKIKQLANTPWEEGRHSETGTRNSGSKEEKRKTKGMARLKRSQLH